jgi:hypothetical protein
MVEHAGATTKEHLMTQHEPDEDAERDKQKRSEADQPPVDGPGGGSAGEPEDPEGKDLGDSSYDRPGGSG